jgi:serine/threonine-protein kinase RsbW
MEWYSFARMSAHDPSLLRLEFTSAFDMLDLVEMVGHHLAREVGIDEETLHWIGVAIRESVVNAIRHGNRNDHGKHVFVEFSTFAENGGRALSIRVRDQGEGFDPDELADPLAPENLLKSSGRGIFLIRSLMDDVHLQRAPEGGMEIRMTKRAQASAPDDHART